MRNKIKHLKSVKGIYILHFYLLILQGKRLIQISLRYLFLFEIIDIEAMEICTWKSV